MAARRAEALTTDAPDASALEQSGLTTQRAASKAQLAWPNAVNHDVIYDDYFPSTCEAGGTEVMAIANDYDAPST